jgi:hypothetical protein
MRIDIASRVAVIMVGLAIGCSSSVAGNDASGDASPSDATVADGSVQCRQQPSVFPTLDTSCTTTSDCALVFHQTDCCGALQALGIQRSQSSAFAAAEATCTSMYPGCGCFSNQITDGTGNTTHDGQSALFVECRAGACAARIRAPSSCGSSMCTSTQVCASGCCGFDGCTPPPPRCADVPMACSAPSCSCFATNPCPNGACISFDGQQVVCVCA